MLTRTRRCLSAVGLVVMVMAVFAMVGTAGAVAGEGFAGGSLVAPFPGLSVFAPSALLAREHESAFGSFAGESPQAMAVDQSTGDVYVLDTQNNSLLRFSASGTPVDFTAGSGASTNAIPSVGVQPFPSFDQVAVDSSTGPAKGDIYVTNSGSGQVAVFASDGESLGSLTGSETPVKSFGEVCGVAVDQSNGDVYIASYSNRIWRYTPSGSLVVEADYSGGIQTAINPCALAVADGRVYANDWHEPPVFGALEEYSTSAFVAEPSAPATASQISSRATAVSADPASGDVYVDEGNQISVFDATGTPLYSFASGDFNHSTGVAVALGGDVYVADSTNHQVDVYGATLEAGSRANLASFGSFVGESPQALTVDTSTGDVYALDTQNNKLLRFSATGVPVDFTAGSGVGTNAIPSVGVQQFPSFDQIAVDGSNGPAKGDIYVTNSGSGQVAVFASDGESLGSLTGSETPAKSFGEVCGVAVDQSNGDVYIASYSNRIWRYTPSGSLVVETDYTGGIQTGINPCALAVAGGHVYANDWHEPPVSGAIEGYSTSEFVANPSTPAAATQIAGKAKAVAADSSTDEVYVDESNKITVYDAAGKPLYSFASGEIGNTSTGIAINASGDRAYVSDSTNHQIHIYGPFSAPPAIAETKPATEIKHIKAILNGHLDPNHGLPITSCSFEWGTDTNYTETPIPCDQGNSYTTPADLTAELTNLTPGDTYHYRLHITTSKTDYNGQDETFETPPIPTVHVLGATFGGTGSGDGQLSGNTGLAVDQSTGDVYVADTNNHRIERFDANGNFISTLGWGVTDGKSELQTCTNNCQAGIAGSGPGQLATPTFVAVDSSGGSSNGDVYVGDTINNTVTKYNTNGKYIVTNDGTASGSRFGQLTGIAVDHNGNLWVYDTNGNMREFTEDGTFITQWQTPPDAATGIAIDPTDTLYVANEISTLERRTATGSYIGIFTASVSSAPTYNGPVTGLTSDPSSDDVYVDEGGKVISEYSHSAECVPQGKDGCPVTEAFGGAGDLQAAVGVSVDGTSGSVYVSDSDSVKIFERVVRPDVTTGAASALSGTATTLEGTVGPNGVALTDCHFEYVSDAAFLATGFADLSSGGSVPCSPSAGSISVDFENHAVTATLAGLDPATIYHYRLVAGNAKATAVGNDVTIPGPPLVETTGSPVRTATTARLDSRLDPRGTATNYHFEYGDQGPCDSNPCTSTPIQQAGEGETYTFVSQQLTGLRANTTYHYRLVAENATPSSVINGQDATITTRVSDAVLTHGRFAGPPGSDRAWEQVSIPNTDGNNVKGTLGIADSGERTIYEIEGGTPGSTDGGATFGESNEQLAERTPNGWQDKALYPTRAQAPGNIWEGPWGSTELTHLYAYNRDETNAGDDTLFKLTLGAPATQIFSTPIGQFGANTIGWSTASDDGSRLIATLIGTHDPAYPVEPEEHELYDISSGTPKLIGLLPGNTLPVCGVKSEYMGQNLVGQHWVTPDGSHAFFNTSNGFCDRGSLSLYDRDLNNDTTKLIAPGGRFIRYAAGAVFFDTETGMVPGDPPGTDIYRYQVDNGEIGCLTCSISGHVDLQTDSDENNDYHVIAVSSDGSHLYFISEHRLLVGAAAKGIYRLDVADDDLVYVAPTPGQKLSADPPLSPDGSFFVFRSSSPELNAVNGQQNGGTAQYYLYDDRDRSLACVSCPPDGSLPRGEVPEIIGDHSINAIPISGDGDFAFTTPTALVSADENTAAPGQEASRGTDVYEWRDGRLLLVTDGKTESKVGEVPRITGMAVDGRDIFFTQLAALTPDAIDTSRHLYDARIGGGFDFPQPPPPCSLEACQGNPAPPPNDGTPASLSFSGPGNQTNSPAPSTKCVVGKCGKSQPRKHCAKGKVLKHGKCVKKKRVKRKPAKRASRHHKGGAK